MATRLNGCVLVFDDLERCSMPLVDVMGFINAFVEHDRLKVIVIASQADIPEGQKREYELRKEKLIGKTLRVAAEPKDVFDHFVAAMSNSLARKAASESKDSVLQSFGATGKENLRSLRSVLNDYDRLVDVVDNRLQANEKGMTQLLLYMMATGLAIRATTLRPEDLADLALSVRRFGMSSRQPKPESQLRVESVIRAHPEVDWTDPIVPPGSLGKLYSTGIIETAIVNAHLNKHPLIVGYDQTPAWRQLWSWTSLHRTVFDVARAKLIQELSQRELNHPGVILHSAGIVMQLSKFGDEILGAGTDLVAFFEKYFEDLVDLKSLMPERDLFGLGTGSHAGLGYLEIDSPSFKKVFEIARNATEAVFFDRMRTEARILFSILEADPEGDSSCLYEYGVAQQKFGGIPLLHNIDVAKFANLLILDSYPNGRLLAGMAARYQHDERSNELAIEHDWVKKLHAELDCRVSRESVPYKKLLEMRVTYYFDMINKHITAAGEFAKAAVASQDESNPLTWEGSAVQSNQ